MTKHENAIMKLTWLDKAELQRFPVQIHNSVFAAKSIFSAPPEIAFPTSPPMASPKLLIADFASSTGASTSLQPTSWTVSEPHPYVMATFSLSPALVVTVVLVH